MKYIVVWLFLLAKLFAAGLQVPLLSVQENRAVVEIQKIDVGMSGFIVRALDKGHQSILHKAVVESFDPQTSKAVLRLYPFELLAHNALPKANYQARAGDFAHIPFAYNRGLVIAPTEDIYYKIVRSVNSVEWIHPDFFATILSETGHPTPLKSDFIYFGDKISVGLVFIYLDELLYTIDMQSLKILNISPAPLEFEKEKLQLPFYSRVEKIDAAWWGEGSSRLTDYEPYYYELLTKYNKGNKSLYEKIKNSDEKLHFLLKKFDIKG